MRADALLAGVGGQGVLTVAHLLAEAADLQGLVVRQGEVHGMSQRGGAVQAMVRLADGPIAADLVPLGTARLVLGLEPLEALRHVEYVGPSGALVTAANPVATMPGYPPVADLLAAVRVSGGAVVAAGELAREAGVPRAANIVMAGAAAGHLPLDPDVVVECITRWAERRGTRRPDRYTAAFRLGLAAVAGAPV